jgi:hypothetical protein
MLHQHTVTLKTVAVGSGDLYVAVRAALTARRSSLSAWCRAEGINRQTAEKALKGERHSRKAIEIRQRLISELFEAQAK